MIEDARRLLVTRGARGFADGLVSVLLASWLERLGLTAFQVGAVVTATLLGSAALTLAVGLGGHRFRRRSVLLGAAALMVATGIGFAGAAGFWPVLVIAFVGTINPSAGDVTVFLPTEQAILADAAPSSERTLLFAWYNLAGTVLGAAGALAAQAPARIAFLVYAAIGVFVALQYMRLSPLAEVQTGASSGPLTHSRGVVLRLAGLFCIDAFGGGFIVQSLLALWLYRRFHLPVAAAGAFFFASGLLGAASQFVSSKLASRIGHVRTMVYTHLPSSLLLIVAGVMPSAGGAVLILLLRSMLSQMDIPARQAYVMAMVPREERAAAASVTNVPRALAAAVSPALAGWLLERTSFGWPLIFAGALKGLYDVALFASFARLRPLEER